MEKNEFEQALETEPGMAQDNEFDTALQAESYENKVTANVAVEQGLKKNPTSQAEVITLSNRHNLPKDFVERNIEEGKTMCKLE